jgi:N utilization substance protein B
MARDEIGSRSAARNAALQILFGLESSGDDPERACRRYWNELAREADVVPEPDTIPYADRLVLGVAGALEAVDARIGKASTNWRVDRMSRVDRNVLRLGAWELAESADVPRAVILDECVELAKRYGSSDSRSFVNGVLDRIATDLGRVDAPRPAG